MGIQTKILIPINLNPVASVSNTNTKDPNTDLTFKKPRSGSGEKKVEKGKEKSVKNKEKTEKGKEKSVPKKPTWDEMMRATLGNVDKSMDHITKRDKSPRRRRRSPRKKRKQNLNSSQSSQDTSDGEESPPELCLGPEAEVSPDSQKILDILQNSLIERMDKKGTEADGESSSDDDSDDKKVASVKSSLDVVKNTGA